MKFNFVQIILFSLLFIKINTKKAKRKLQSSSEEEFLDGVYLIKSLDGHMNLKLINKTLYFSTNADRYQFDNFHIYQKEISNKKSEDYSSREDSEKYFYIEEKNTRKKLYYDEAHDSISLSEKNNPEDDDKFLWEISTKSKNSIDYFEIKSKLKSYYISYEESQKELSRVYCEDSWITLSEDRSSKFNLVRLYKDYKNINKNPDLLEKEPIDVVIKYIDLNDTSLDRKNFEQIEKDQQNNELKYSLRSILQNIPWIRKIYIIMPNEKIPYLKDKKDIEEKIVYIKDKDVLGFDSSSPPAFKFNLHKLKKYDLSENFILMDDDYFISQPLKKSDFFYEDNGKIFPYLTSTDYYELDEDEVRSEYVSGVSTINDINYHSEEGFNFRKASTLLLVNKIFSSQNESPIIEVGYTHNAIPLKISDVEEVYNSIEKYYQYIDECLNGKKRNMRNLEPHILFMNYIKNKYDRPVKEMSWKYYDLSDVRQVSLDISKLFVINVEDKDYHPSRFKTEEEVLNDLFPKPTKYEIENVSKNEKIFKLNENININTNSITNLNKNNEKLSDITSSQKDINKDNYNSKDLNDLYIKIKDLMVKNNNKNNNEKIETKKEEVKPIETQSNKVESSVSSNSQGVLTSSTNNYDRNNPTNDKIIERLEKEMNSQKYTFSRQFTQIQEQIAKVRSSITQIPNDNSLLIKQFQIFNDALIEIGKKISAIQEENTNLKKKQLDLIENISKLQKEIQKKEDNDDDNNPLKTLYDNIYDQSEKIKTKINKLSDENYSIGNKINEIKTNSEKKDEKIKEITEENYELTKKVKNLENEISEWKRKFENNMENAQKESSINERNEGQINRLNSEISQLKESLDKFISKSEEKKGIFDGIDGTKIKYGLVFIICLVAIYFIYVKFIKNGDDSNEVPHMKLSQQYGGYGRYSNSLM